MIPSSTIVSQVHSVFHASLHPAWVLPFVLMLLAIAILPLTVGRWWEKNRHKLYVSIVLGLPVLVYFGLFFPYGLYHLAHTGVEYVSFLVLLASLFIISGGIFVEGDIRATPVVNTIFLILGSILASFMGTTGAAMVLLRPLLNTNSERKYVVHTVIFFTFLVGNIGGCLTPIGDPPLFMGYLFGVPFSWTFQLWRQWAFAVGMVTLIYFVFDTVMYTREPISRIERDVREVVPLRLHGSRNLVLLLFVVLAVALVTRTPYREVILVVLAAISLMITEKSIRKRNEFTYNPIIEVAVLFFGIFLTMVPAIYLLRTRGSELGVTEPWQFFWASGGLSSFLDNTPTYVVFFNLAQSLGMGNEIVGMPAKLLVAISLGSVFFGANTYIGNAPNFMIKAIAEERKIKMPSFFGYMVYSGFILIPVFIVITYLWFV